MTKATARLEKELCQHLKFRLIILIKVQLNLKLKTLAILKIAQ